MKGHRVEASCPPQSADEMGSIWRGRPAGGGGQGLEPSHRLGKTLEERGKGLRISSPAPHPSFTHTHGRAEGGLGLRSTVITQSHEKSPGKGRTVQPDPPPPKVGHPSHGSWKIPGGWAPKHTTRRRHPAPSASTTATRGTVLGCPDQGPWPGGGGASTRLHHSGIEFWDQKGLVCLAAHLPCVVNQQPFGVAEILEPFGTNGGNPVGLFEGEGLERHQKTPPVEVGIWTGQPVPECRSNFATATGSPTFRAQSLGEGWG